MRPRPRLTLAMIVLAACVLAAFAAVASAAQRPPKTQPGTTTPGTTTEIPARCQRLARNERLLQRCIERENRRGGGGGGGGGGGTTTTPTVTGLKIAPKSFRAATTGGSVLPVGAPATVTFTLSAPAQKVRFRVQRPIAGRWIGGRCRALTRVNRSKPKCVRPPAVLGTFLVTPVIAAAGASTQAFGFTGRVAGKALKPGAYQLLPQAIDATRLVNQAAVGFVIKKPAKKPAA